MGVKCIVVAAVAAAATVILKHKKVNGLGADKAVTVAFRRIQKDTKDVLLWWGSGASAISSAFTLPGRIICYVPAIV